MTSFPSDQEYAFQDAPQRIEHETITHYETTIPSETDINRQPQKTFSFNDKIDTSESLRQKAQAIISNGTGNYYSAAVQPADVDSKDLNSRLDKLLKSAETALTRAKTRGGSVSHHQVSSPIIEIDSALTFNTEGNKRNIFIMQTPSVIPQEYSPSSQPSQPTHPLNQSLSLSSAGLSNQNPINFTPNALSHRYEPSPLSQYASQTIDPNTLTVSYNLSSDTQKRSAGLSSIPVSSSIKYTPTADQVNGPGPGGNYTSRSYTVGTESEQRSATPSYENQMQNMNTLPRSYNLFPIRETERSSHVSNNNLDYHNTGGNDVSVLKKGINNVEEMLRSLDNNHVGVGGIVASQDLLTKTLNAQFDQNRVDYSTTEPYERENNSYISTIYPLKTKEFEVVEQPKKSYATNSEYSQSYNNIPNYYNYSSSYSPEGLKSSALRQSELEGQEKTHLAMKNIDQLMHRHIFQNRPLTKSTVDLNQPLRYMSPTRGSGQSNEWYGNDSRQWATLQPQTQTLLSEQYPREREVRAAPAHSYQASLHATPKISVSEAPKSIQQFREPYHSDIPVASHQSIKENTYISPVKDLTLPRSYGSTTNYKEYLSSPRPARSHLISSPLQPDERELSYADNRASERFKGTGLTFGQGIDYDRYYNPEILNSADRKMKRLTLKAKSPEERDSESKYFYEYPLNPKEERDQYRYTPSDIKEVYGAEYLFSEPDASHFDFRPSSNEAYTDPDSHRRTSPKAVPNQFKAGELMADRESSSRGALQNVTKAGELQDDHHVQHQHTYQTQSSVSHFKAGDLQHDHEGFRAGDLQPDRDQAFKAGELQPDHDAFRAGELQNDQDKQNFNSGDLEDERAQKALQSRNVADDGRAWQMVHKIDSRILESVEHSFDFEHAGGLTPQNQQIPHESLKRGHAPTSEEKRLQRVVDPNLWIVNPPKVETYNASKGSQMLKQSVKKAHKKPIITHCFEKFEDREFTTSNSKR